MTTTQASRLDEFKAGRPGAYQGISFADYLALDAVNWHTLAPGRKSAKHMRHAMLTREDASASMVKGGALDCLVFDGLDRFDRTYATMPKFDGHPNSNAHKEAKAAWQQTNTSAVPLTRAEMDDVRGMYHALHDHPIAWPLLSAGRGRAQLTIVWTDAETGLKCKGRIDRLAEVPAAIIDASAAASARVLVMVDLKSTHSPGVERNEFPAEVARYGYHGQMAYYEFGCMTLQPAQIVPAIVSVENEPPFDVIVHRLDIEAGDARSPIEHGRRLFRRLLDAYAQGKKRDVWPGQCSAINPLVLPSYATEPEAA